MNQHQQSSRPDDAEVLGALSPIQDGRPDCRAFNADYALDWCVYPVAVSPVNGEFRKTLRVRTGRGEVFDFSAKLGFTGGASRTDGVVRNVHRPTDGASLRSKLCSLDMLLDLGRMARASDSVTRRVLGFAAPRRIGLWELRGTQARVFVDPVTLIEQLVAPEPKIASLLLSPFMGPAYETAIDEDKFVFRSSGKLVGDFLDLRSSAYPKSNFGLARCLAYWLGSHGRACELDTVVTSLLDPDAPLSLPTMFGKVPVRLTCVVENSHYLVLKMQSLVYGAYWPRLFDRLRLEDSDSGLALEFSEQAANSASLMWWGPCEFDVGAVRCAPSAFTEDARKAGETGIFKRLQGNERFWPTLQDQGANRSVLLLDGQICPARAARGELPYLQPIRYAGPDGLPLQHREGVLDILRSAPGIGELAQMLSPAVAGSNATQPCGAVEMPPEPHLGRSDSDAARLRLGIALVEFADSAEWEPHFAKQFDISLRSVRAWASEVGPNPTRRWNNGHSADINVVDPLLQDSLPPEVIDAIRALRLRGCLAYGLGSGRWTVRSITLLARAVGFPQISDREARMCIQSAAPHLADGELLQVLRLADPSSQDSENGEQAAP